MTIDESSFKTLIDSIRKHGQINFRELSSEDLDAVRSLLNIYEIEMFDEMIDEVSNGTLDRRYLIDYSYLAVRLQAVAERMGLDSSPIDEVVRLFRQRRSGEHEDLIVNATRLVKKYTRLYSRIWAIFHEDWSQSLDELHGEPPVDSIDPAESIDPFIDLDKFHEQWKDAGIRDSKKMEQIIREIANDNEGLAPQTIIRARTGIGKGLVRNLWGKLKRMMNPNSTMQCIKKGFGRPD